MNRGMLMSKKLMVLLVLLLLLGSSSTVYAAEESIVSAQVITLEQAKGLAKEHSRTLKKYEINVDKAKYQQQQSEDDQDELYWAYNSLGNQIAALYESLNEPGADAASILAQIERLEEQQESQYDKIESSSDSSDDAEDTYDDAVKEKENYRKQLDYLVEQQYTEILNLEASQRVLIKEIDVKKELLNMERKRLVLGSSQQAKVDELAAGLTELNKKQIEQANSIKTKKGQFNDLLGRSYDASLELVPLTVSLTVELPEYQQLLSDVTYGYDRLSQLKRDLDDLEDDYDDEEDYYKVRILSQEIKALELDLANETNGLYDVVNNLLAEVQLNKEAYELAAAHLRSAQRTYQWNQKRFELGQISKVTLLESELSYLSAENQKISTGYGLSLSWASLKLAAEGILL